MIRKFCRQSGSLSLKTFRTVWNIFILSGRYPYCAKLSRHSVKFPDTNNWKLSCVFVWNQSRFSGNPPKNLEGSEAVKKKVFQTFRKIKQTDSQILGSWPKIRSNLKNFPDAQKLSGEHCLRAR
jgi:hypothetical protein